MSPRGELEVIRALLAALDDPEPTVQLGAARALEDLETRVAPADPLASWRTGAL